jgi:hypothetical protein
VTVRPNSRLSSGFHGDDRLSFMTPDRFAVISNCVQNRDADSGKARENFLSLLPEKPGALGRHFGACEAPVVRKQPDNTMEKSKAAVLDWISRQFAFEKSPRSASIALPRAYSAFDNDDRLTIPSTIVRYAFLENCISSFRSDVVASESRFNVNDIIRDRQHATAATLDSSIIHSSGF